MEAKQLFELTTNKSFQCMNDAVKFYDMGSLNTIIRSIESGEAVTQGKNAGLRFSYCKGVDPLADSDYPTTRKEAKATGATYYFTGKPCKRGHIAKRETKGNCAECRIEDVVKDNASRIGKPKSAAGKAAAHRYYIRNREEIIAKAKAQCPDKKRAAKAKYKAANPEIYKALVNTRRRRLKDCQPPWITQTQKDEIREMYATALRMTKITGEPYEVDHIVPVNSDIVCGLHVPWNLQILHKMENLKKSNTVDT